MMRRVNELTAFECCQKKGQASLARLVAGSQGHAFGVPCKVRQAGCMCNTVLCRIRAKGCRANALPRFL